MFKKVLLLLLVFGCVYSMGYAPKTEQQLIKAHYHYDIDANGVLDKTELQDYFKLDYMKAFQGIDIDPKFIDSTLRYIQTFDIDSNGISTEELIEAVLKGDKGNSKKQTGYYPEQEL